jgi:catechol-2,3-dioxygenase
MSRIRPARFVHVVYRTRRFQQMIEWYRTVFDCRVQYQNPALAFLTYDDEHHRVALINLDAVMPDAPAGADERRSPIGVDHVAYTYGSVDDLFENYAQLKAKGILPYWCVHHGVTLSMYYADPDGNQMELQVDAFASSDEANRYMHGPHFKANPIGVEYDPDEMLARLRSGTPGSAFLQRKDDLPVSPIRGTLAV